MKKTYIAPKTTVVELETTSLMVGSPTTLSLDADYEVDGGSALEGGSRSSLWGED